MPGTSVLLRAATEGYRHFHESGRYNLYHRWSEKYGAAAIKDIFSASYTTWHLHGYLSPSLALIRVA